MKWLIFLLFSFLPRDQHPPPISHNLIWLFSKSATQCHRGLLRYFAELDSLFSGYYIFIVPSLFSPFSATPRASLQWSQRSTLPEVFALV